MLLITQIILSTIYNSSLWGKTMNNNKQFQTIKLPKPETDGDISLETTLQNRRSVRNFSSTPVPLSSISQLLWAAQGITHPRGFKTAPSAGALYPLDIYVFTGNVRGLNQGIYQYRPIDHSIILVSEGDYRGELCNAALRQQSVNHAPAVFVITGISERITGKYGERGIRYMFIEAGHAAQNLCLQAVASELGSVVIGAFSDDRVSKIVQTDGMPIYIIPVGKSN